MSLKIQVDIVSAEEQIFSGEAEYAVFPGESGELGILPRHAPLLTRVRQGTVRVKLPDRDDFELIYISGGILEVQPALITLLADTAVRAESLDAAKVIEAKQRTEEAKAKQATNHAFAAVEAELAQSISRMRPRSGKRGI